MVQISHRKTSDAAQLGERSPLPGAGEGWEQRQQNDRDSQRYLSPAVEDAVVVLGEPVPRSTQPCKFICRAWT